MVVAYVYIDLTRTEVAVALPLDVPHIGAPQREHATHHTDNRDAALVVEQQFRQAHPECFDIRMPQQRVMI